MSSSFVSLINTLPVGALTRISFESPSYLLFSVKRFFAYWEYYRNRESRGVGGWETGPWHRMITGKTPPPPNTFYLNPNNHHCTPLPLLHPPPIPLSIRRQSISNGLTRTPPIGTTDVVLLVILVVKKHRFAENSRGWLLDRAVSQKSAIK